ncbi:oligomeric subunit-like protein, putative [Medicago truncatula]|uniref:Oligomeric subunit-like protein, putative n=1 Tax=Medicago truncatula TaxID=3880 RepID=G7KP12_MEDTR|nr:oligomeric subunit-like protein, putative [Medicago truncatula]
MQGYCTSRSAVLYGSHIFNCLRFQEIAGSLDSVLTTSSLVPVQNLDPNKVNYQDLTLKSSVTLLESLRLCWREENGCVVTCCQDRSLFSTTTWRARK